MKKVLIFWLWNQWKKYMNYFYKKWYLIDVITKSWNNQNNLIKNIYSFDDIIWINKIFFNDYEFIIISVSPYSEQDKVIQFLLELELKNKIIIEKPGTYNLDLLKKIINYNNITFFIDELILWNKFRAKQIETIDISLPNGDRDIFEHIIGFIILRTDFKKLLKSLSINNFLCKDEKELIYNIKFLDYDIICKKWIYFINKIKILNNFDNSLDYIINNLLNSLELNKLYKNNFYLFQEYVSKNKQSLKIKD